MPASWQLAGGLPYINADLKRYCDQHHITFTRCRPYKKNDQAHIEQKNWTAVRQTVGYDRYEGEPACQALETLYRPLRLYVNFFQPVMVLLSKEREGAKLRCHYDQAKTPYQRALDSDEVLPEAKERLRQLYATLNPAALLRQVQAAQEALWPLACHPAQQDQAVLGGASGEPRFPAPLLPEGNEASVDHNQQPPDGQIAVRNRDEATIPSG